MKRETNYKKLIENEVDLIKERFKSIGKTIDTMEDIGTYDLWLERGRKVKMGEKALLYKSAKAYPTPIWTCGGRKLDENGKPIIRKFDQKWSLFSKDQTKQIKLQN